MENVSHAFSIPGSAYPASTQVITKAEQMQHNSVWSLPLAELSPKSV